MTDTVSPSPPDAPRAAATTAMPTTTPDPGERAGRLRPILFRLHFFGGFFAAPVAVWLALTGILFAWNPQIDSWLFGDEKAATRSSGELQPLSSQVSAALAGHPDHEVVDVIPADEPGETTAVHLQPIGAQPGAGFGPAEGAFTAYVDPVDTSLTGAVDETRRPDEWIRNLHSNFRLGTRIGTVTELAASWVLVSLLTGLYLWWPKSRSALQRALVPRLRGLRGGGRRPWRDLHSSLGFLLLGALVVMVLTGLTWTEYAGSWVDVAKDNLAAEAPTLQTELAGGEGGASGGGEGGQHHGGAGAGDDEAGLDLEALDQVAATARAELRAPYTISPAGEPGQAWTVAESDSRWPIDETSLAVDPSSGDVVDRLEFGDQPLLDQATSVGIGFHEGSLFGLPNQVLLTLLAAALMVVLFSGYVMWWKRRPAGAFGAPPKLGSLLRTVPLPLLAGFVLLGILLPTMGVSFLLFLAVERIVWVVRGRRPPAGPRAPSSPSSSSTSTTAPAPPEPSPTSA
jgi:uncharacterized iron-regulated membrane protein